MKGAVEVWAKLFCFDLAIFWLGWWQGWPLPVSIAVIACWDVVLTKLIRGTKWST